VAKKKLARFSEILEFNNVVQAGIGEVYNRKHPLAGQWAREFFGSSRPVVLELGCGKGEYTVGLAGMFPDRNFIGIDIKGSRMWKGAKQAIENKMQNVGFLRTRIEFINAFFDRDEIDEIWITFPDPQPRKPRKRLTSPAFLNRYRMFLKAGRPVHLKTDSRELYEFTLSVIGRNGLEIVRQAGDIYRTAPADEVLSIKTYYEQQFLGQGKPIHYLAFRLDGPGDIIWPDEG
jgi:tRNA (guanine-N7-)-methyltransferase